MDDGGTSVCIIVIFFVLLLITAILYGFQKAITLMNVKEIERKAQEEKDKKSILLYKIVERSTIYVNSIQMIITLIDLVMGYLYLPVWTRQFQKWIGQITFLQNVGNAGIGIMSVVVATICLMYILLTFGTLFPKKLAQRYPDAWAYMFIRYIQVLRTLLYPVTGIVAISANGLLRVLGFKNDDEQTDVTEEEIISMVNEGHEQGVLLASEAEMIHNIFEFSDKEAKDIMTHRKNLIAIDGNLSYNDAVSFIIENSKSRYPVYLDDIDNIIGVLHIKDAFAFAQKNEVFRTSIKDIPNLIREVDFVPETLNIHTIFKMMQAKKSHMVIVVDEYGQTSGAVAMEDILEEIVGNIEDEHDEEESLIRMNPDGSYLMNGLASMPEVIELLRLPVEEDAFETLNGFLVSLLEKIPNDGETAKISMYGYDFNILKVEDKMIREVLVRKAQNVSTGQTP